MALRTTAVGMVVVAMIAKEPYKNIMYIYIYVHVFQSNFNSSRKRFEMKQLSWINTSLRTSFDSGVSF